MRGWCCLVAGIGRQQAFGPGQQRRHRGTNTGVHAREVFGALQLLEHFDPRHTGATVACQVLQGVERGIEQRTVEQIIFFEQFAWRAYRLALDQPVAKRFEPVLRAGQVGDLLQHFAVLLGVQAWVVIQHGAEQHQTEHVVFEGARITLKAGKELQVAGQPGAVEHLLHAEQALAHQLLNRIIVVQPAQHPVQVALLRLQAQQHLLQRGKRVIGRVGHGQQGGRSQRQPTFRLVDQGQHEQVLRVPGPHAFIGGGARQFDTGSGKLRLEFKSIRCREHSARLERLGQAYQARSRVTAHPAHPVAAHRPQMAFAQGFGQLRLGRRVVDAGGQGQGNW
ncbi:hypothetical protein D3C84_603730 [compost metagenome]